MPVPISSAPSPGLLGTWGGALRPPSRVSVLFYGAALETRARSGPPVSWRPLRDTQGAEGFLGGLEVTAGSRAHTRNLCCLGLWLRPCGTSQGLPSPPGWSFCARHSGQGKNTGSGSPPALGMRSPSGLGHFCVLSSLEVLFLLVLLPGALWNSLELSGTFWNILELSC